MSRAAALVLLAILVVVALRHREPDPAVATHWCRPSTATVQNRMVSVNRRHRWAEHDDGMDGIQADPYPWQVLGQ